MDACLALVLLWAALQPLAFLVAGADKRAARRRRDRVSEATFHVLAILGAWPGCVAGFVTFRHKTRKAAFLAPFALAAGVGTVVAGALLWACLLPRL